MVPVANVLTTTLAVVYAIVAVVLGLVVVFQDDKVSVGKLFATTLLIAVVLPFVAIFLAASWAFGRRKRLGVAPTAPLTAEPGDTQRHSPPAPTLAEPQEPPLLLPPPPPLASSVAQTAAPVTEPGDPQSETSPALALPDLHLPRTGLPSLESGYGWTWWTTSRPKTRPSEPTPQPWPR